MNSILSSLTIHDVGTIETFTNDNKYIVSTYSIDSPNFYIEKYIRVPEINEDYVDNNFSSYKNVLLDIQETVLSIDEFIEIISDLRADKLS